MEIIGDVLRLIVLAGLGIAGILAVLIWKRNKSTRVSFLRLIVQLVALAALFYVFSLQDPAIPLLYVLVFWFASTLILGRFFCGWICPFAFIMDIESYIRKALRIRYRLLPDKLNVALHKARYAILAVFLILPIPLWLLNPPQDINFAVMMAQLLAGPFRPYSIIVGPLIPFIVPWTGQLIIADVNFSYPYIADIITFIGPNLGEILAAAFVTVTLVGAFFIRRVWCRFCPAGASFGALSQVKALKALPLLYIEKEAKKCTKCGVCKRVCPVQVNEVYDQRGGKIGTSQCMLCTRCVEMCPYEDALKVKLGKKTLFKSRNWLEPSSSE